MPLDERDRYENLILLCEEHHHIVDSQVATYPVERLRQMKYDHESLIAEAVRKAVKTRAADHGASGCAVIDRLFSSLLPVERLPRYVFSIEFHGTESDLKKKLVRTETRVAAPFICRSERLFCFQDLRNHPGPFLDVVKGFAVERDESTSWWNDHDKLTWYITLLNRTLNKLTGWRGLNLDKEHHRYYFQPDEPGKPKSVAYRPMNRAASQLQVVWQPVTRKTKKPKNFWYHRAIAMSFVRVGPRSWCLALRPEMRVTRDSITPVESRRVGEKVTKKKSRMWNIDVLEELNFWRDFFFEGGHRLIIPFGTSNAISISANFLSADIHWPGVPPDRAKSFKNAVVEENLFDLAALDRIDGEDDTDDELIDDDMGPADEE